MTCQPEAETITRIPCQLAGNRLVQVVADRMGSSPASAEVLVRVREDRTGQRTIAIPCQPRKDTMATFCPRCGRRLLNAWCSWCAESVPDQTVGRFQIRTVLGVGRLGSLVRAYDPALSRTVVLRTLSSAGLTTDAVAHYLAVLRAAVRLPHPNCVDVYAVQSQQAGPVVVMEDLSGGAMGRDRLGRPASQPQHLQRLSEALNGLAFLHKNGLAHGRVTPTTVLLTSSGTAKLTEPGLGQDPDDPQSWELAAPEILLGDGPSPAADVFSAGAILWFGSAGCPPFRSASRSAGVVARRKPPWGKAAPAVAELAQQAMAFDPMSRPTSSELAQSLTPLLPVRA